MEGQPELHTESIPDIEIQRLTDEFVAKHLSKVEDIAELVRHNGHTAGLSLFLLRNNYSHLPEYGKAISKELRMRYPSAGPSTSAAHGLSANDQ